MRKANIGMASILMSLVEILIGILLLINPVGFTSGIINTFGIVIAIFGISEIIQYFRLDAEEAAQKDQLTKGILFTVAGLFCVFKTEWFIATFPVITLLYGVLILVTGVSKLQKAIDMLRLKRKFWYVMLISSVLTLVVAVLAISNPFTTTAVLWTFIGVSLIVEAVMDVVAFVFAGKA